MNTYLIAVDINGVENFVIMAIDPAATMMIKFTSKAMLEAAAREELKSAGRAQHEIDALVLAAKGAKSK